MKRRWLSWLASRWLWLLVIIALLALLISRRVLIEDIIAILLQGQWEWMLGAALLQLVYYALYTLLFQAAFAAVGIHSRARRLVPLLLASVAINSLAPSAGLGGAALFVDDAARRGYPVAQGTEGMLVETIAENIAVVLIVLIGLLYLLAHHALLPFEVAGVAIYLVYTVVLAAVLFLGRRFPGLLRRFLNWLQRAANALAVRVAHRELVPPDWAGRNAAGFEVAANAILRQPRRVKRTLLLALAMPLVNVASLYAVFEAFGSPVPPGALAVGVGLGMVFAVLSILPFDAGLAQGIMVLVFDSLGVPTAQALVAVLAWGGLNTWLPVLIGLFFLHRLRALGGR